MIWRQTTNPGCSFFGDRWHRTEDDPGRPYRYVGAETLLDDFLKQVERVLGERGVASSVIGEHETRRRT